MIPQYHDRLMISFAYFCQSKLGCSKLSILLFKILHGIALHTIQLFLNPGKLCHGFTTLSLRTHLLGVCDGSRIHRQTLVKLVRWSTGVSVLYSNIMWYKVSQVVQLHSQSTLH